MIVKKTFTINETLYGILYDEVWLLFNHIDRPLDQNGAFAGLDIDLDKAKEWHPEIGYMHQPSFTGYPETEKSKS